MKARVKKKTSDLIQSSGGQRDGEREGRRGGERERGGELARWIAGRRGGGE